MAKFFGRVLLSPVLLFLLSPFSSLWACTPITVNVTTAAGDTSAGSLGDAINQINANGTCGGTIDLSAIAGQTVNMSGDYAFVTQSVTILGNNVILNGQNAYQGLSLGGGVSSVSGMSVSIANLSFVDTRAQGGAGGDGAYGGGGGAGLGGGIFVNTGVTLTVNNVNFNGNSAIGGNGGGYDVTYNNGAGGGGGLVGNGQSEQTGAGNGGGPNGGAGANFANANGGNGGWGGGGGGQTPGGGWYGGNGGFGGGGGASYNSYQGSGGFGGGSSGGGYGNGASPGLYGGAGFVYPVIEPLHDGAGGGGGAGLGGGIFLYQGAGLNIIQGDFSSNSVQGGGGGVPSYSGAAGQSGQGLGQDLFIYGSTVTFGGGASSLADSLEGTGGVMVNNSSTVTLSGNNTYSGGTTISSALVNMANNNALGTGNLILDGGTLQAGVANLSAANAVSLTGNNGTFDNHGNSWIYSGVLSGVGSLAVTDSLGGGSLTLTGNNSYSGGTHLETGLLNLGNNNVVGTGAVTMENNTSLQSGVGGLAVTNNLQLNGAGTFDKNGNSSVLSGVISGTGSLSVTDILGGGNLTLTGNNSYSGGTHLFTGLLNLGNNNALGTGAVTMENNTTLQSGLAGLAMTNNLSLNGAGTFDTNGVGSALLGVLSGTGSFSVNDGVGGGSLTLTGNNTYSGGTNLNGGLLSLASSNALGTGTLTYNGGNLQTSASINLGQAVSLAGDGTLDSNGFNSTLSGVISGAGNFTKTGAGALTLTGTNTYTGLTDVNNGSLVLGTGGALANTAPVTVESNGTLDLNGHSQTLAELSGSGSVALGAGNLTVGDSTDQLLSGVISGPGSLTKVGIGILTLTGSNTYGGATTVSGGELNVSGDGNLGLGNVVLDGGALQTGAGLSLTHNVNLTANGGTLDSSGFNSTVSGTISGVGGLNVTGSGTITLTGNNGYSGATTLSGGELNVSGLNNLGTGGLVLNGGYLQTGAAMTLAGGVSLTGNGGIDTNGFNSTVSGAISGTGALGKVGAGSLTLTGANTYSGGTAIGGGTLDVGADGNLGTGNLSISNATLQLTGSFDTAKNLNLGGSSTLDTQGNNLQIDGTVSGNGTLTKTGAGALTLTGNNSFSGSISLVGGTLDVASNANLGNPFFLVFNGGTLQANGNFSSSKSIQMASNGTFDTNGYDCALSDTITGSGNFIVTGSGALTLLGKSFPPGGPFDVTNYRGLVDVRDAIVVLGLGGRTLIGAAVTLESAGILELGYSNQTIAELSGSGQVALNSYNLTVGDANNQVFSGSVSGTGALIKQGSGTLALTGVSTYSGGTQVNGGTLSISNDDNLGTGALELNGGTLQTSAAVTSSRSIALASSATFDTQTFNSALSGVLSGTGSLTKIGTGTLTLDSQNTYMGGTNVNAGALMVGDANTPGAYVTGSINVAGGAVLTGYGAILGSVTNNGILQAGGSSGTLSIAQLDETAGSTLQVQVGAGNGQSGLLDVLNAQLGGAVSVTAASGNFGIRSKYLIVASGTPLIGTFSTVEDDVSYMTPILQYGANTVTLVMTRNNVDFTTFSQTPNGTAVGMALNASLVTASDDFINHLNNLYGLPSGQAKAVQQMSGSSYAPLATSALDNNFYASGLLFSRMSGGGSNTLGGAQALAVDAAANAMMADANGLAAGSPSSGAFRGFWLQNDDSFGSLTGNDNVVGYDTKSYGFVGGYDTPIVDALKGGVAFSYSHATLTSTDGGSSTTGVDSYLASLYGTRGFGDLDFSAVAGFGWDQYATTRSVSIGSDVSQAQGNFAGNEISAALQGTYHLKVSGVVVNPLAGVQYTRLWQYGFTESGAGSLDLTVAGQNYDSLRPMVGVSAIKVFDLGGSAQLVPGLSLTASRELMNVTPQEQASFAGTPGENFTVTGIQEDPMLYGVGAGVKLTFGENWNLSADYKGHFGGGQSLHSFNGGIELSL